MSEPIKIEYGVIIATYPEATVVVKPVGQDQIMVFVGNPSITQGIAKGELALLGDVEPPESQASVPVNVLDELHQEIARLRDEVASLDDCREHLRRLGQISGCDHVDSPDSRAQQVRHIEDVFDHLQDEIRELRIQLRSPT